MLKNIRTKIFIIFVIFGIIITALISSISLYQSMKLEAQSAFVVEQYKEQVKQDISLTRYKIYGVAGGSVVLITIFGVWFSGVLVKPFSKLINTAEDIVNSEESKSLDSVNHGNVRSEIDKLVNALSTMNSNLKENLSEVTRQKKQIETILQSITDGIIAFNMKGDIIHINNTAKKLLKADGKESFADLFNKYDIDIDIEKLVYLEDLTSSEVAIQANDKYINLFFESFKDENELAAGVIVVLQDITESVKLDSSRKEFMANVSHELKTPLTVITGGAELLLENEVDKKTEKKFLTNIQQSATRMWDLVQDLIELSRYESNNFSYTKEEFDVSELTKEIFEELKIVMEKRGITGECLVTSNIPNVYADKKGIRRAITNILTNAIKYNKDNGSITVYLGYVYNDVYIKVIDTGIGISQDDLTKIFDRFYTVDKSRVRKSQNTEVDAQIGTGTGLGLSIVQEIINKNDGKIDIKSELGKGTEVVLRIPTKKAIEKQSN